jgi:hypothetical protein
MKKPAIPSTQSVADPVVAQILRSLKENVELMTGVRAGVVQPLPVNADLPAVISKVNEIIAKLNYTGQP